MSDTTASDTTSEVLESVESASSTGGQADGGFDFSERYGEVIGKVNQTLNQVDWAQMGKIGKASGIILAVIVAQILIKGVLDTINLLPIIPGLLELLGLVIVGQWSWNNLTTGDKRHAVIDRIQGLRKEYLG
ncbi:MAG: CAAD domain-containing protein [Cyanobium sp.]